MTGNDASAWPFPHGKKWEKDLQRQLSEYFALKKYRVLSPSRSYILAKHDQWHDNIILPRVWEFVEEQKQERSERGETFALHKWVHHGLSSQALLSNLLGPLVVDRQWGVLDDVLRAASIPLSGQVTRAGLEVEDREVFHEWKGQPTSIDLALQTRDGDGVLVECKFTEKNFGGCSVFADGNCDGRNPASELDLCYLHHLGRRYWQLMEEHGLLSGRLREDTQCPLSTLYQLYRLILFALEKAGHFLLIYDERNPSFLAEGRGMKRGVYNRVYESLPKDVQQRCHAVSTQTILRVLDNHPELGWVAEFRDKYLGRAPAVG